MKSKEIGKLTSVKYNKQNDEVFVTFKVIDPEYKEFALRVGKRDDIQMLFVVGEKMHAVVE